MALAATTTVTATATAPKRRGPLPTPHATRQHRKRDEQSEGYQSAQSALATFRTHRSGPFAGCPSPLHCALPRCHPPQGFSMASRLSGGPVNLI
jgi:hypothetical protein